MAHYDLLLMGFESATYELFVIIHLISHPLRSREFKKTSCDLRGRTTVLNAVDLWNVSSAHETTSL